MLGAMFLLLACAAACRTQERKPFFFISVMSCGILSISALPLPGLWQSGVMTAASVLLPVCLLHIREFCLKANIRFLLFGLAAGAILSLFPPDPKYLTLLLLPGLIPPAFALPRHRLIPSVLLGALLLLPLFLSRNAPEPLVPATPAAQPDVRSLYKAVLTACAEYDPMPDRIEIFTAAGEKEFSPDELSREFLHKTEGVVKAAVSQEEPDKPVYKSKIVLIAAGIPANFFTHNRYTLEYFRRMRHKMFPNDILAVMLPESFSKEDCLAVCAALKQSFPYVIRMHTPEQLLLASCSPSLTADPEELDARAAASGLYTAMDVPDHLLILLLPLFQTPEEDAAFLKETSFAEPNRANSPRIMMHGFFSVMRRSGLLLIPGALILLYAVLRYLIGWKPERKMRFRMFEAGLYFAGAAVFAVILSLFCFTELDFFTCITAAGALLSLSAAFLRGGKQLRFIMRILLPAVMIFLCTLLFPVTRSRMIAGMLWVSSFPMLKELERAAAPVLEGQISYAMFFAGAGAAFLLFPTLFLLNGGIWLAAGLLLLLLAMRIRS